MNKIEFNYQRNEFYNPSYNALFLLEDEICATLPLDYNVYHLNQHKQVVDIKYTFDFGNNNIPETFRMNNIQNMDILKEIMALYKDKKVAGIENIIQYHSWLIAFINGAEDEFLFYSLKEQKAYSLTKADQIFAYVDHYISTDGTELIATIQSHYFDTFKNIQDNESSCMGPYMKQLLMLPPVDEEDNPIVCFIKLK